MHQRLSRTEPRSALVPVAVRASLAVDDTAARLADGLASRVTRLRDDGEAGSQVAEYALIGGVAAAVCGGLIAVLKGGDIVGKLIQAVVNALIDVVRGWF